MGPRVSRVAAASLAALVAAGGAVAAPATDPPPAGAAASAAGSGSGTAVKDPKMARKWLSAARQLVARAERLTRAHKDADAKQQLDDAITAYEKAIEAGDDLAVYVELADAEARAGEHVAAYKHLQFVLDPSTKADAAVAKKAQAKLDDVSMKIGTVNLTLNPDGTTVMLAQTTVGVSPLSNPIVLEPGTYKLSLTAVGYQPKDLEIRIDAGAEEDRTISLDPVPVMMKAPSVAAQQQPPPRHRAPWLPVYIGAGATGGLVIAGTITGILAVGKHHTFINPNTSPAARDAAQRSGKTLAHVTDACFGAAILAGAFTAYWYVTKIRTGEPPPAKVGMAPWVQPDGGGLVVAGHF